jgi:hypothetical protein
MLSTLNRPPPQKSRPIIPAQQNHGVVRLKVRLNESRLPS